MTKKIKPPKTPAGVRKVTLTLKHKGKTKKVIGYRIIPSFPRVVLSPVPLTTLGMAALLALAWSLLQFSWLLVPILVLIAFAGIYVYVQVETYVLLDPNRGRLEYRSLKIGPGPERTGVKLDAFFTEGGNIDVDIHDAVQNWLSGQTWLGSLRLMIVGTLSFESKGQEGADFVLRYVGNPQEVYEWLEAWHHYRQEVLKERKKSADEKKEKERLERESKMFEDAVAKGTSRALSELLGNQDLD